MVVYMRLTNSELKQVTGGVSFWAVIAGIAGFIFGLGVVDGYTRPVKCRR